MAACVFAGSLAIPMGFEILWRFDHVAGSHQQPEVVTVEVGGQDLVHDKDPYVVPVRLHHPVKYHPPGQPNFEGFLPYLPLMAVAGIPSEIWPNNGLSDARIFFCLTTLAVAAVALYLCRANGRRKIRALQALIILPLGVAAAGHRRRRHPRRGLPAPGHGPGATATALRLGRRLRHRLGHEVHRLAPGRAGALRRARAQRRAPPVLHAGRHARRGRPDDLPLRPARPLRPHRRRRALPARVEQDPDDSGQRAARSRAGERVPVPQPGAARSPSASSWRSCWRGTSTGARPARRPRSA